MYTPINYLHTGWFYTVVTVVTVIIFKFLSSLTNQPTFTIILNSLFAMEIEDMARKRKVMRMVKNGQREKVS